MARRLDDDAAKTLAWALHAQLNAPASAAERRVAELGFLTRLLDEVPHDPDGLPLIPREHYEKRQPIEAPDAPKAARLVERYKSWKRACWAAWGLQADGRSTLGGMPWSVFVLKEQRPANYTRDDAIAALQTCAARIGRLPSSKEYHAWRGVRKTRARSRGETERLPSTVRVLDLLAPRRQPGEGWTIALAVAFPQA